MLCLLFVYKNTYIWLVCLGRGRRLVDVGRELARGAVAGEEAEEAVGHGIAGAVLLGHAREAADGVPLGFDVAEDPHVDLAPHPADLVERVGAPLPGRGAVGVRALHALIIVIIVVLFFPCHKPHWEAHRRRVWAGLQWPLSAAAPPRSDFTCNIEQLMSQVMCGAR